LRSIAAAPSTSVLGRHGIQLHQQHAGAGIANFQIYIDSQKMAEGGSESTVLL
jgi:hypothetical protein